MFLRIDNEGDEVRIHLNTELPVKKEPERTWVIPFVYAVGNEAIAQITAKYLLKLLTDKIEAFAKENYNKGYKDGKHHKSPRRFHPIAI